MWSNFRDPCTPRRNVLLNSRRVLGSWIPLESEVQVRCHLHRPSVVEGSNDYRRRVAQVFKRAVAADPKRGCFSLLGELGRDRESRGDVAGCETKFGRDLNVLPRQFVIGIEGKLFVQPLEYGLECAWVALQIPLIQTIGWAVDKRLCKAYQHRTRCIESWGPEQVRSGFSLFLVAITRCDEDRR